MYRDLISVIQNNLIFELFTYKDHLSVIQNNSIWRVFTI